MIQKVLLAVSGTGNSVELLQYLMDLPAIKSVSVTVLHVVSKQTETEAMATKMKEGQEILDRAVQTLGLEPSKISALVREGDPKDVVCKAAEEIDADLIIMGSRGLKRLVSILENSVSQYVFQLTNRPMLLVRDDLYVKRVKRVMVALDKTDSAQLCLDLALFLLQGYSDGELILARVNPDLDPKLLPLSPAEMESNPVIAAALPTVKRKGIKYRCAVAPGRPGEQICNLADEYNVDLLILGSPDRRPSVAKFLPDLDRLLGSSLSDYVRVKANCPVLLARKNAP